MTNKFGLKLATVASAVVLSASLAMPVNAASIYSSIYVFGDSLSDTGNIFIASGNTAPSAPYFNGRFSNGPVWVEYMADSLGLQVLPSQGGGTNYAWGGARTSGQPGPIPPLDLGVQSSLFLSDYSNVADPDALYVVWGGGNDALAGNITGSANNIGSIITSLANAGAKNFLVPNLGVLAPIFATFNTDLTSVLDNVDSTLNINLKRLDANAVFNAIVNDTVNGGALYGFTSLIPCFNGISVCSDPDKHVFWDSIHPTTRAYEIVGDAAYAAVVPLPGAVWLFASGCMAFVGVCRRERRQG